MNRVTLLFSAITGSVKEKDELYYYFRTWIISAKFESVSSSNYIAV